MTNATKRSDQDRLFEIELLTVQQVADWAKVSPKSVYRWIEAGKVSVVKFGEHAYRIPAKAVIAQLKSSGYDNFISDHYGFTAVLRVVFGNSRLNSVFWACNTACF